MRFSLAVLLALTASMAAAAEPNIRLVPASGDQPARIIVAGIEPRILNQWRADAPADWSTILAVHVGKSQKAMLGTWSVTEKELRFEPRFALVPGLNYHAVFSAPGQRPIDAHFLMPLVKADPTLVNRIFPTADRLPENQLKFYFHFSAPMSRGEAYDRIHLLDERGREVSRPFLELDEELWSPDGLRFTLFIHPGRIKRGLKPREEEGPVLVEGGKFTLVVDAAWPDATGRPLKAEARKSFAVDKPDDFQPDPKSWKLSAPARDGRQALRLQFPESLDQALLIRLIWVEDAAGKRVPGTIETSKAETVWEFTPEKPWAAGEYHLRVDTRLEDLAGNNLERPFEVDVFRPVQREVRPSVVSLSFSVK